MAFELTESLINDLIFAMENQTEQFLFDSSIGKVISLSSLDSVSEEIENEDLYSLPEWSPDKGFELLEDFTQIVRIPKIKGELKTVLANGRGVFKNYKNTLKKYPNIEKRFYSFKSKKMRSCILTWYNSLRESWGLEKMSQDFESHLGEYDDLIQEDFSFREYNPLTDRRFTEIVSGEISSEIMESNPGELGLALSQIWKEQNYNLPEGVNGFLCRTFTEDFAGFLLYSHISSTKSVQMTNIFVDQNYRGLGIAGELMLKSISELKQNGIHLFLIADFLIPEFFEPFLLRQGFKKIGSIFVLEISNGKKA